MNYSITFNSTKTNKTGKQSLVETFNGLGELWLVEVGFVFRMIWQIRMQTNFLWYVRLWLLLPGGLLS
jgi:hypothetical protein